MCISSMLSHIEAHHNAAGMNLPLLHRKSMPSSLLTSAGVGMRLNSIHVLSMISSLS